MHVGTPEALGLGVVGLGDVVAEADAGGAVEALVGLLVDAALAVRVGGDEVLGQSRGLDRLRLERRGGAEGSIRRRGEEEALAWCLGDEGYAGCGRRCGMSSDGAANGS